MMVRRIAALGVGLWACAAAAQDGESARCQVGSTEVQVVLRESSDGLGNQTVHLVRRGKPDLAVKFEDDGKRSFFSPFGKAKSACDKTLGLQAADLLFVTLAEEGNPGNPFLVSFVYSVGRDEVTWRRRAPEKDRIAPEAQRRITSTGKEAFCLPTRLVGEADTGLCVDDCGSTHGALITSAHSTLAFDVVRCFRLKGDGAEVSVDADQTWKAAWPELKSALGNKDGFERAFGFDGNDYAQSRAVTAKLSDGRVCAVPSAEPRLPRDPEAWLCPTGKRGK